MPNTYENVYLALPTANLKADFTAAYVAALGGSTTSVSMVLRHWQDVADALTLIEPGTSAAAQPNDPTRTIVRAVQTCSACPAQWDAWTADGQYLYLRYRWGQGSARAYDDQDQGYTVASFEKGNGLSGSISLEDFCAHAGLKLNLTEESA